VPDAFEIAQRYFSTKENNELAQSEMHETEIFFLNCWTRKEAFIKASGDGLSYPLADFSVSFGRGIKPEVLWIKGEENKISEWKLYDIDIDPDYITSLAIRSTNKNIVIKKLKP
ncbi:MAG: 4'-phosphopantetheinyl transferase superfamily protein, partial [bacterium]